MRRPLTLAILLLVFLATVASMCNTQGDITSSQTNNIGPINGVCPIIILPDGSRYTANGNVGSTVTIGNVEYRINNDCSTTEITTTPRPPA